ncbi:hypothetical protein, partial [Roseibium sp. RKSG952]|uniref:hypothetical protein n=1 Tax=Roseibium sp. RKSG952 TaxID=2529384 RepID=UPI001AD8B4DC
TTARALEISATAARTLLADAEAAGLLREITGRASYRVYALPFLAFARKPAGPKKSAWTASESKASPLPSPAAAIEKHSADPRAKLDRLLEEALDLARQADEASSQVRKSLGQLSGYRFDRSRHEG